MQFSALVFVVYINNIFLVGRKAAFSVNNIPPAYRGTTHYTGAVPADIYLSTVSIAHSLVVVNVVNVREGREDGQMSMRKMSLNTIPASKTQTQFKCLKPPTHLCLCVKLMSFSFSQAAHILLLSNYDAGT